MDNGQRKVSEVEGFINMLLAACEDKYMHATLERLLELPDAKRKNVVQMLAEDLEKKQAPAELIEAIGCLVDSAIAEKAYEVIYQCKR